LLTVGCGIVLLLRQSIAGPVFAAHWVLQVLLTAPVIRATSCPWANVDALDVGASGTVTSRQRSRRNLTDRIQVRIDVRRPAPPSCNITGTRWLRGCPFRPRYCPLLDRHEL
jgi:hypothetical protein